MAESGSPVRKGYDRWASVYDHDANPMIALEEAVVRSGLGDVTGRRALDLGCGTGRHALWLAEHGAHVTAVDFSDGMLDEARRKPGAERIEFIAHDLHEPLPFEDGQFDLLVNGLVLEHIDPLAPLFAQMHRVLKRDGVAIVSAMHPAMFLRGAQARFTDPESGAVIQPGSVAHSISAFVMAALHAHFIIDAISEHAPDAAFARRHGRAEKYIDWPMLVVMRLRRR